MSLPSRIEEGNLALSETLKRNADAGEDDLLPRKVLKTSSSSQGVDIGTEVVAHEPAFLEGVEGQATAVNALIEREFDEEQGEDLLDVEADDCEEEEPEDVLEVEAGVCDERHEDTTGSSAIIQLAVHGEEIQGVTLGGTVLFHFPRSISACRAQDLRRAIARGLECPESEVALFQGEASLGPDDTVIDPNSITVRRQEEEAGEEDLDSDNDTDEEQALIDQAEAYYEYLGEVARGK